MLKKIIQNPLSLAIIAMLSTGLATEFALALGVVKPVAHLFGAAVMLAALISVFDPLFLFKRYKTPREKSDENLEQEQLQSNKASHT